MGAFRRAIRSGAGAFIGELTKERLCCPFKTNPVFLSVASFYPDIPAWVNLHRGGMTPGPKRWKINEVVENRFSGHI